MRINTGLFGFELADFPQQIRPIIQQVYGESADHPQPVDFRISLTRDAWLRRFLRPQISFICDQHSPFKPLPLSQAYPLLEWGMNWCVAAHDFYHLILHSAVLVKNNRAILFPAHPGSGKSTLTAYMSLSGWDLYSDEMAIIDIANQRVKPVFRPICLKNNSIDLVKQWYPQAYVSPRCRDTQKGDVSHVKAISWARYQELESAEIVAVVFPKYIRDKELEIYQLNQLQGFEKLIVNAFNYNVMGQSGFDTMTRIIDGLDMFEIQYSDLAEVSAFLEQDVLA